MKVALFGSSGRMGQCLKEEIQKARDLSLVAEVDRPDEGAPDWDKLKSAKPEAVIDFSSPEGAVEIARWCAEGGVALVSGTTGLSKEQSEHVRRASEKTAVLVSPNMSPGLNAMAAALKTFLRTFAEGEVVVEETHHKMKKDAPSGTAKFLQAIVKEAASKHVAVREPVCHREGDVFGIHKIKFSASGEWMAFEHHAMDRGIFARGALAAARWLVKQPKGFYEMKDFLK